jgi:hypothetical protein
MKTMWLSQVLLLLLMHGMSIARADTPSTQSAHPVFELRQYKIVAGKRDAMIALFEREFIESQEAVGAQLVGQFRDTEDANRFTWIRAFPDMTARADSLTAFYYGPVWQAHRAEANPMLSDNDNVLLLRPAWDGAGFVTTADSRGAMGHKMSRPGAVTVIIYYLWKAPAEGFTDFFREHVAPNLKAAGLPVLAAFVPEEQENNFPRLPVRQGEKLFVWITRTSDRAAFDLAFEKLTRSASWKNEIAPELSDAQERASQTLHLTPTERSLLR